MLLEHRFYFKAGNQLRQGQHNDHLAWDWEFDRPPTARNYEIAAIAPDLFDITYYSVEPNASVHYQGKLNVNRQRIGISDSTLILFDLGSHPKDPSELGIGVQRQMQIAQSPPGVIYGNLHRPDSYYFVRSKEHLLTGWTHPSSKTGLFSIFPEDRYGRCFSADDNISPKNPGSCVSGGRTGYSVKLISRAQLLGNQFFLGGQDAPAGAIRNPPPDGF